MVIPFLIIVSGRGVGGAYGLRAQAAGRSAEAALEVPAGSGDLEVDGAALGRAVFVPAVRQMLLDVARGADEAGARIQIQLRVAPELTGLPWEWLSLGSQTLWQPAMREDYALVRVGQAVRPPPPLPVAAPLRLLIAAAPGCSAAADALGAALLGEVRARRLIVDRLRDADPVGLAEALDEEPCHLLHLIAPATPGLSSGPARASLPRLRLGRNIDPPALARLIGDHPELRMVALADDEPESVGALAALAVALHEGSGLATLALGALDGASAADFCATCYGALASGEPVDLAATLGRARLAEAGGPWGAPQILVASGGEALFRIGAVASAPQPARRGPPRPVTRRPERGDDSTQPVRPIARPQPRPALAGRDAPSPRPAWLTPRLIALALASLILVLMVSQVMRRPEDVAPTPTPAPTALSLPTSPGLAPPSFPTLAPPTPTR
ncbi:polysaccharide deacetylase [Chloroflexales bacterium ZM16-3]|nr:polysaccharide deacetylase [Chloroflexales bacterium ZM16-3]